MTVRVTENELHQAGLVIEEATQTARAITDIDKLRQPGLAADQFAELARNLSHEAIAAEIRHAHYRCKLSMLRGLDWAYVCGRWLCWAKESVPHGEWEEWVRANTKIANSTARCYQRVFRRWEEIKAKRQQVGVLTINQALGYTEGDDTAATQEDRAHKSSRNAGVVSIDDTENGESSDDAPHGQNPETGLRIVTTGQDDDEEIEEHEEPESDESIEKVDDLVMAQELVENPDSFLANIRVRLQLVLENLPELQLNPDRANDNLASILEAAHEIVRSVAVD